MSSDNSNAFLTEAANKSETKFVVENRSDDDIYSNKTHKLEDEEEVINKRDGAKGATTNKRKALEIQKSTKSKKFSKQKRLKK